MTLNNLISKSIYYGEGNTSYGRITAQQEYEQILLSLKNRDMDAYKKGVIGQNVLMKTAFKP